MDKFRNTKRVRSAQLEKLPLSESQTYYNTDNGIFYRDMDGFRVAIGDVKFIKGYVGNRNTSGEIRNSLVVDESVDEETFISNFSLYYIDSNGNSIPLSGEGVSGGGSHGGATADYTFGSNFLLDRRRVELADEITVDKITAEEEITAKEITATSFTGRLIGNADTATTAETATTADTATKLKTAITIAGKSFDGSENIDIEHDKLTNKNTKTTGEFWHVGEEAAIAAEELAMGEIGASGDLTAIHGNLEVLGETVIHGNLEVLGETVSIKTTELEISDNIIMINKSQEGTPSNILISGLEVERGDKKNFQLVFVEKTEDFRVGKLGELQPILTRDEETALSNNDLLVWDSENNRAVTKTKEKLNIALDSLVVHKAGDETITGDKTFNSTTTVINGKLIVGGLTIEEKDGYIDITSS